MSSVPVLARASAASSVVKARWVSPSTATEPTERSPRTDAGTSRRLSRMSLRAGGE
jgi:hypothetical protein